MAIQPDGNYAGGENDGLRVVCGAFGGRIPLRGNGTRAISRGRSRFPSPFILSLPLSLSIHRERTFADASLSLARVFIPR